MADDAEPDLLGSLAPHLGEGHRSTIGVLVAVLRTGRLIESWLSSTLAADGLDTSEFTALMALYLQGDPHRLSAGEISDALVQTTGGTTKTIRRLEDRGMVKRVADPGDGRRSLVELSPDGLEITVGTLHLVLDAFDLEIGDLDEAERVEVGVGLVRLSAELGERLDRR
ncbi:MAG: MarR family winged helix-turn-helix transcriptional regulator [Acidimicrobiales bacterium]